MPPWITKNLLSVSKFATDNHVFFEFHPTFCFVKDLSTKTVLMHDQLKEGFYVFNNTQLNFSSQHPTHAFTTQKHSTRVLHSELSLLRNQHLLHQHLPLYCGIIDLAILPHILFLLHLINVISLISITFLLSYVLLTAWEKSISPYSCIQHPLTPHP